MASRILSRNQNFLDARFISPSPVSGRARLLPSWETEARQEPPPPRLPRDRSSAGASPSQVTQITGGKLTKRSSTGILSGSAPVKHLAWKNWWEDHDGVCTTRRRKPPRLAPAIGEDGCRNTRRSPRSGLLLLPWLRRDVCFKKSRRDRVGDAVPEQVPYRDCETRGDTKDAAWGRLGERTYMSFGYFRFRCG